jgi:hypothetical protein
VNLAGAWRARTGSIAGLVLQVPDDRGQGQYFLDRVVQCIRAPCPPIREQGQWHTEGRGTLVLSRGRAPSPEQRYEFERTADGLTLRQGGREVARLVSAQSYCREPSDCRGQVENVAACVGDWSCNPDATCSFQCGSGGGSSAPVQCGQAVCPAGQVCCNPLRSICTPPGMMCIQ